MNFAFPEEMLHCLQPPTSPDNLPVSVDANAILLGRQTSGESLPWQQEQHHHFPQLHGIINTANFSDQLQHSQTTFSFLPDPTQLLQYPSLPLANLAPDSLFPSQYFSLNGSPHFPQSSGFTLPPQKQSGAICRTSSCPPHVGTNATVELDIPPPLPEKIPSAKEPSRKRKTDKAPNPKHVVTDRVSTLDDCKEKRTKREVEPESNNGENSTGTSKENSKVTEVQKPDYIHVRARRGQATDSHSLAERVRREKISERMKYLQDLVPGCNKITGKAGMLDEIINYVQSLQRQVEFLSMKLAAVNPRVDFNIDNFLCKEMSVNSLAAEIMANQGSFQFNFNPPVMDHVTPCCGADMVISPPQEMALRRTTSAPLSAVPDGSLIDSNFHVHVASSACWNVESRLHSVTKGVVEDPGKEPVFPPDQSFRGDTDGSNILKMEISGGPAFRNL